MPTALLEKFALENADIIVDSTVQYRMQSSITVLIFTFNSDIYRMANIRVPFWLAAIQYGDGIDRGRLCRALL